MQFPTGCLAQLPEHGTWKAVSVGRDLANATWRIDNGQVQYLVKQYAHDAAFGRATGDTVQLDRTLADRGIAPEVIWSDVEKGICIFRWLDAATIADEFDPIKRADLLGRTLAKIHQQSLPKTRWTLRERVEQYCQTLEYYNPKAAAQAREDCQSYGDLFQRWENGPHVFCHHDLNAEHVFLLEQPQVIDWEYAGYGHPGFDLASTLVINDLYDDEIDTLLESYQQFSDNRIERDELRDWVRLVALVNRIWFSVQDAIAQAEAGDNQVRKAEHESIEEGHQRNPVSVSR
ncbi:phosphotransferase [Aliidiomarina halalkaliphila]|uniref:Phosphotransferase n=1 Tax=Aliidiomarina halalkaliphila TaxID=2593535 RepID=A0A552X1J6_9GAMM|nr:phosphotransferase [Aliidiomarina halalkaliphila]TRW48473.1 phosphotransferase [Aliidiomarina halalkaliphila]